MVVLKIFLVLVLAYLAGSIPSGLVVVKVFSGKDVRDVGSGRTGGTNAMRAAGIVAGLLTAVMDVLKGIASGWVAGWLMPGNIWLKVLAALLAIIGHNYSVFLISRDSRGRLLIHGGAGGATALGGAIALWNHSWLVILPLAVLVFIFIGYASVTTISIALISMVVFTYRAILGLSPWAYIIYGIIALIVVLWSLRPNLKRLKEGTERAVGLRAYLQKKFNQEPTHR